MKSEIEIWLQHGTTAEELFRIRDYDPSEDPLLIARIQSNNVTFGGGVDIAHPNAKAVEVVDVDQEKHDAWVAKGAGYIKDAESKVFESAAAASAFLKCTFNEVAARLGEARRQGEKTAKVRGLVFSYVEDILE